MAYAHWAAAVLDNGLGRYDEALAAARQASEDTSTLYISMWALPELIEAAARTGDTGIAAGAPDPAGGVHPGRGHRLRRWASRRALVRC